MSDLDAGMQLLRGRFVAAAAGEADRLTQAAAASDWDHARMVAHGLAGRSGMFGFHRLGELALGLEEAIESGKADAAVRLHQLASALRALDQER